MQNFLLAGIAVVGAVRRVTCDGHCEVAGYELLGFAVEAGTAQSSTTNAIMYLVTGSLAWAEPDNLLIDRALRQSVVARVVDTGFSEPFQG